MSELVTKSVAQEQQEQKIETRTAVERSRLYRRCDSPGRARRPRRHGRLRAGQVLAEIAERNRVLRLQGIRGLGDRQDQRWVAASRRLSGGPASLAQVRPGIAILVALGIEHLRTRIFCGIELQDHPLGIRNAGV